MEIPIIVGERIRQFRAKKHLSQEALAHLASITPSYLGQVERGQKSPTLSTLIKITNAMEISLNALFSFDDSFLSSNFSKEKAQIWAVLDEFDDTELHSIYVIMKELYLQKNHQFTKVK